MVDSHFHTLHMIARDLPGEEILEECFAAGMSYGLDVGIVAETFARRAELASRFSRLYLASGFYPSACEDPRWRDKLPLLEDHLIQTPRAAALGEIGLDFNRMYGTRESQKEVMAAQIELANRLGLPVIIHSRDAAMETLELLHRYTPLKGGILHCFSYGPEWVDRFAELDLYFSFAGNITYKKSPEIREAVKQVPPDRLLVETDAPYLSPQPVRHKINHPGLIGYTYEAVARETERSLEELITLVNDNFVGFLSLSGRFVP
jgi:TatD DNase family protein